MCYANLIFSGCRFRGNALLVGSIGTHLTRLARLALYMLEYAVHPVDCSYPNTFLDGLRSAVRQAGCDGKTTTVLFTVSTPSHPGFRSYTTRLVCECPFRLIPDTWHLAISISDPATCTTLNADK